MKRILKISSLFLLFFALASQVQAQKFGYINSSEILATFPEVKQAEANLEALQKQLTKKGQGMVETLQKDYTAIQQKVERGELSPVQQEQEAKKLQEEQARIAKFEQDMVKQIQDKREELLKPIYEKVNKAIEAVAKEGGYQFIFDKGVLLYFDEGMDVSAKVKAKLGM
jgi:outer membrane protein